MLSNQVESIDWVNTEISDQQIYEYLHADECLAEYVFNGQLHLCDDPSQSHGICLAARIHKSVINILTFDQDKTSTPSNDSLMNCVRPLEEYLGSNPSNVQELLSKYVYSEEVELFKVAMLKQAGTQQLSTLGDWRIPINDVIKEVIVSRSNYKDRLRVRKQKYTRTFLNAQNFCNTLLTNVGAFYCIRIELSLSLEFPARFDFQQAIQFRSDFLRL